MSLPMPDSPSSSAHSARATMSRRTLSDKLGLPVPSHRARNVTGLVRGRIHVNLDYREARITEIVRNPLGRNKSVGIRIFGHIMNLQRPSG